MTPFPSPARFMVASDSIIGHSDIRVPMLYAHFAPDHLEEAIALNPLTQTFKDSGGKVATEEEKGCNTVE